MNFKPTPEQQRIFKFIKKRPENILIKAFAGCGKTTTIVESINYLPKDKNIMFLAFNKHIQMELKTRLPEHVRCYTSHGLGMSAIKRKYKDSIVFDEFKVDKHIRKKSARWGLDEEFGFEDKFKYMINMKRLINLCRASLTLNPKFIPFIAEKHEISNLKKDRDIKRVLKVLDSMTLDRKTFDYTDMIYLPAIDKSLWLFPQDYVIVDEVQDLNRCQIRLIEKMLKKDKVTKKIIGRLISVGDYFQGIYGFNAADEKSFAWFEKFPNTKVLSLSSSFRCSKNVIKKAQTIVPEINALPDAPDGIVRSGNVLEEAESGDFVLSRTTAPLIKLFFGFLIQKKKAMIKGGDIGLHLIDLIGKLKTLDELITFWEGELVRYRINLSGQGILNPNEHSGYMALEDKVNTLVFLAKISTDISDLIDKIKTIFTDNLTGIVLSTVHKIKGLEANRVFIVRPDLIPLPKAKKEWQIIQETNLEYVAITRAKTELIYDYDWTNEEDEEDSKDNGDKD